MVSARLLFAFLAFATTAALAHHVDRTGPPAVPARTAQVSSVSGFVAEVVIDDRVAGKTSRIALLHADDGSVSVLLGAAVASLQSGAAYVVTGRASGRAIFVDSARMMATTDTRAATLAALPRVSVAGTLRLGHADNFDGNPSEFFYAIVSDTEQYRVSLATLFEGLENAMTGSVSGSLDASGELFADHIIITGSAAARLRGESIAKAGPVTTSYIVLPVKFPTNAAAPFTYNADPFTVASLNTAVFGAGNSVAQYYNETSFGQQLLSGTVANNGSGGWLLAERATPTTCDINAIATAAESAATARGYNLASYTGRVYVFTNNVPGCGWAGLAYVGWERSWIKQTSSLLVIGHELGHNFGLLHAASLDCGTNVIGGTCSSSEYGDPFGIMGNQRAMHFSSPQKLDLGWITAGSVKTHTAGRQTYTLSPLETAGGSTYAVKIPAAANRTYWLEYRQPIGFDSGLSSFPNNGAQVRVTYPFESICSGCSDDTQFLDMTPETASFTDGALVVGKTYTDATYGVQVTVTSATANTLTLDVAALGAPPVPDFDFSGTTDIVWRNDVLAKSSIWAMDGAAATAVTVVDDPNWAPARFGDFNGDGQTDLVWRNGTTGHTALWLMNGLSATATATILADPQWQVTQTGDFDGDGKSDLLLRNSATGQTAMWLMNGLGAKAAALISTEGDWTVTHVGDLDGDGKSDLVWRSTTTGATAVRLMNGLAAKSAAVIVNDGNWRVTHVADLDGDGKRDLVWRHASTGQTGVWLMNGITAKASTALTPGANWQVTHVADLDGDGKADLVLRNESLGQTSLWLMDGTTVKSGALVSSDANWAVWDTGDFNGDGNADLLWRQTSNGAIVVWLMNGQSATASTLLLVSGPWTPARLAQ